MARTGNQHCANCIGTLSFPTESQRRPTKKRRLVCRTLFSDRQLRYLAGMVTEQKRSMVMQNTV